jgi:F-type H+-transporting ATPase subunit epsilon
MPGKLTLEVITAERVVFQDEVDTVSAPAVLGTVGILPRHAPMLTALEPGELKIEQGGQESFVAIGGGFLEVRDNRVVVLADSAERGEEIDVQRAEEARLRARERLRGEPGGMEAERAAAALAKALTRLRVAERARRRGRGAGGPLPSQHG